MENVTFNVAPAVHVWHVVGVLTFSDQTPDGHPLVPPPVLPPTPLLVPIPEDGHEAPSVAHETPSGQHVG